MMNFRLGVGVKFLAYAASLLFAAQVSAQTDPLPSWNDGAAKTAIIAFVKDTTTQDLRVRVGAGAIPARR